MWPPSPPTAAQLCVRAAAVLAERMRCRSRCANCGGAGGICDGDGGCDGVGKGAGDADGEAVSDDFCS